MSVTNRIGTYLFLIGIVLVFLFIFSDAAGTPAFGYFFIGALCLIVGGVLWWRTPAPPSEPPARFRSVKKLMKKNKKEK